MSDTSYKSDLAKIHIAKQQLGLDDDTYRDMLWAVARVRSAADLKDDGDRRKVLAHLRARGFKAKPAKRAGRKPKAPAQDKAALMAKLEAQLTAGGYSWQYAEGIAKRSFKVDRIEWLTELQLYKLVQMLAVHARRQGRAV